MCDVQRASFYVCVVPLRISVTQGLKHLFSTWPSKFREDGLCLCVNNLREWRDGWNKANASSADASGDVYVSQVLDVLECFIDLFRSSLTDVDLRPNMDEVRSALRTFEVVQQRKNTTDSPTDVVEKLLHDLVMNFSLNRAGMTAVTQARVHCQQGLRDSNLTSIFSAAVRAFQTPLEEKGFFDDVEKFVLRGGSNGVGQDTASLMSLFEICQTTAARFLQCQYVILCDAGCYAAHGETETGVGLGLAC